MDHKGVRAGILDGFTRALQIVFPPRCISCGEAVASDFGLCLTCWQEAGFIEGLCCDACGAPLPGQADGPVLCDDCLDHPRPWAQGRAVLTYSGTGRKLVLALKHGDRLDLARPFGGWLARTAAPLLHHDTVIVPIPLHRMRLLKRRYNQSALLARELARHTGLPWCPDALVRNRRTLVHEGLSREERHINMRGAITGHVTKHLRLKGRAVLIVDDVMTSGATFAAATKAAIAAGARQVDVLALARVAKDA